jgi:xanthine dehydrogenase accessory factor
MEGVYEIAPQVSQWLAAGRDVRVATVVATRGFSSQVPAATTAWTAGAPPVGALLDAIDLSALVAAGLVEVTISADDAARAGLACGGVASVLVSDAAALPTGTWERLVARDPLCLVTPLPDGATQAFTATTMRDAYPFGDEIARLFARGVTTTALTADAAIIVLWPVPTLVVVGDGLIADALHDAATLLGWPSRSTSEPAAAGNLHRSDAVVVLSHDRAVDGPALAAALAGGVGYVGALGSRRTQAARREWLTEHGVPDGDQARIHGPAGLDIDAHTPAEIAISIVAEILATRSSAAGGSLRDRAGPVHTAGVHAPPPRY